MPSQKLNGGAFSLKPPAINMARKLQDYGKGAQAKMEEALKDAKKHMPVVIAAVKKAYADQPTTATPPAAQIKTTDTPEKVLSKAIHAVATKSIAENIPVEQAAKAISVHIPVKVITPPQPKVPTRPLPKMSTPFPRPPVKSTPVKGIPIHSKPAYAKNYVSPYAQTPAKKKQSGGRRSIRNKRKTTKKKRKRTKSKKKSRKYR